MKTECLCHRDIVLIQPAKLFRLTPGMPLWLLTHSSVLDLLQSRQVLWPHQEADGSRLPGCSFDEAVALQRFNHVVNRMTVRWTDRVSAPDLS